MPLYNLLTSTLLATTALAMISPADAQQAPTDLGSVNANASSIQTSLSNDLGPFASRRRAVRPPSPQPCAP